jgi:hypothetical protein
MSFIGPNAQPKVRADFGASLLRLLLERISLNIAITPQPTSEQTRQNNDGDKCGLGEWISRIKREANDEGTDDADQ